MQTAITMEVASKRKEFFPKPYPEHQIGDNCVSEWPISHF